MDDEFSRETEPSASLDPPARKPPTAVATAEAPGPDPAGKGIAVRRARRRNALTRWLTAALDLMDVAADLTRDALLSATRPGRRE